MVLNLRASRAYICPEVTWRSPGSGADANGGCARKPMQAFVPILPHGGGYLSTRLERGGAHLLSAAPLCHMRRASVLDPCAGSYKERFRLSTFISTSTANSIDVRTSKINSQPLFISCGDYMYNPYHPFWSFICFDTCSTNSSGSRRGSPRLLRNRPEDNSSLPKE